MSKRRELSGRKRKRWGLDASPAGLTAAARMISPDDIRKRNVDGAGTSTNWQSEAWDMMDIVGELRFLVNAIAGQLAQAALYVGKMDPDAAPGSDPVKVDDAELQEILTAVGGGRSGASQIMHRYGVNMQVSGECWLVGVPPEVVEGHEAAANTSVLDLEWFLFSSDEVSVTSAGYTNLQLENGSTLQVRAEDLFMIRIWRAHPRRGREADSPTRASLPVLRELVGLTKHISAQIDSRLAGAGLLLFNAEASAQLKRSAGLAESDSRDPMVEALTHAMMTPIQDRESASALVPLVVTVPEPEKAAKLITFATHLDGEARELREEAIRRLALGMDAPPELMLGTADMNHWCRPVGTLALTRDGWKVPEVGEDVLTSEGWSPVTALYQADATDDVGLKLTVSNLHGGPHSYEIEATVGHSFLVERGGERLLTKEPKVGDIIFRGLAQGDNVPSSKELLNDDLVRLLAWYSADGSRGRQVYIAKRDNWPVLENVLKNVFGNASTVMPRGTKKPMWREEIREDGLHKAVFNAAARDLLLSWVPRKDKAIPLNLVRMMTFEQLEMFLEAWEFSDGHRRGSNLTIKQRSRERLEAPALAAVLLGKAVRFSEVPSDGFAGGMLHQLTISEETRVKVRAVERIRMDGEVWCPTTWTGDWLALDPVSGWTDYTGNSAWIIKEDTINVHVKPPLALLCDALTEQYLRPIMLAKGYTEEEAEEHLVWFSVEHLIARPNRTEDAKDAHAAGAISDSRLLELLGLPEEEDDTDKLDPAVAVVLDLLAKAPSLAMSPGIPALIEQVTALMGEGEMPLIEAPVERDNPSMLPDTLNDPAEVPNG